MAKTRLLPIQSLTTMNEWLRVKRETKALTKLRNAKAIKTGEMLTLDYLWAQFEIIDAEVKPKLPIRTTFDIFFDRDKIEELDAYPIAIEIKNGKLFIVAEPYWIDDEDPEYLEQD